MELKLGKKVFSSDNQHVGHADGFVLDFKTREVESVIVRSGVSLVHDRVVARRLVDHVDADDTVVLTIPLDEVRLLPEFYEEEFVAASPREIGDMPIEWVGSGTGAPPVYFGARDESFGYGSGDPFYVYGPVDPPSLLVEANVPERDIVVKSGTTVVASDGKTIGHVEEVGYGPDGLIDGVVVKAGFVLHHDVRVPGAWIAAVGSDHIRLSVTSDQVRQGQQAT